MIITKQYYLVNINYNIQMEIKNLDKLIKNKIILKKKK